MPVYLSAFGCLLLLALAVAPCPGGGDPTGSPPPATGGGAGAGRRCVPVLSEISFRNVQYARAVSNDALTRGCLAASKKRYGCNSVELTSGFVKSDSPAGAEPAAAFRVEDAKQFRELAAKEGVSIVSFLIDDLEPFAVSAGADPAQDKKYVARVKYGVALGCKYVVVRVDPTTPPESEGALAVALARFCDCAAGTAPTPAGAEKPAVLIETTRGVGTGIPLIRRMIKKLQKPDKEIGEARDNVGMLLNLSAVPDSTGKLWEDEKLGPFVKAVALETYRFDPENGKDALRDYVKILETALGKTWAVQDLAAAPGAGGNAATPSPMDVKAVPKKPEETTAATTATRPENPKPEQAAPKPEQAAPKPDSRMAETQKPEQAAPKPEQAAAKVDTPKTEQAAPKSDTPKTENPKPEQAAPKPDTSRTEGAKPEQATPKPDPPKANAEPAAADKKDRNKPANDGANGSATATPDAHVAKPGSTPAADGKAKDTAATACMFGGEIIIRYSGTEDCDDGIKKSLALFVPKKIAPASPNTPAGD